MTFATRLVLVIMLSVLVTLGVIAGGAFVASEEVSAEIEQARVSHLLGTLRSTTEANLSIGLSLDQISLLQARIEREKANDSSVLAIDVFNSAGRSLYGTDRGSIGELVGENWIRKLGQDGIWHVATRGEVVFGTRFENDLGVAGGIAVTVSDAGRRNRTNILGLDLSARSALVALAAIVSGALASLAFAHVMTRPFDRVTRILRGEEVRVGRNQPMELLAARVKENWTKADTRIDRGMEQLEALDDAN
jgi:hypothetical protein